MRLTPAQSAQSERRYGSALIGQLEPHSGGGAMSTQCQYNAATLPAWVACLWIPL